MTTVSVILPVVNRAEVVGRAIDSVLAQTHEDFELVVLDGGSTDGTVSRVESYSDHRVRLCEIGDTTLARARNIGAERTTGSVLAFIDSDDVWAPVKLERHVRRFETTGPDVGAVYSGFRRHIDGRTNYVPNETLAPREGDLSDHLLDRHLMTPSALSVRRAAFRDVGGFDDDLRALEDWDICLRLSRAYRFAFVDEPLVDVYVQSDSMVTQDELMLDGYERLFSKHDDRFRSRPAVYGRHLFRIGARNLAVGRTSEGRRLLRRAVSQSPRPLYALAYLIARYAPHRFSGWWAWVKSASGNVNELLNNER